MHECEVAALDIDPPPPMAAPPGKVPVRLVWEAERLKDAIISLDMNGGGGSDKERAVRLQARLQPKPVFKLTVSSCEMGAELSYPPEALETFDVAAEADHSYRFALLALALRALKHTNQALMRVGRRGCIIPCARPRQPALPPYRYCLGTRRRSLPRSVGWPPARSPCRHCLGARCP